MPNRRSRWRAPRSTPASIDAAREAAEAGASACSRARAPICCSPTSRRPRPATRARCASCCPRRCARRAIRPGWPTAIVSEHWAPVSPVTGRLDAFEWRVPMERLGQLIEQDDDARDTPMRRRCACRRPVEDADVAAPSLAVDGRIRRAGCRSRGRQLADGGRPVPAESTGCSGRAAMPPMPDPSMPWTRRRAARRALPDDPGVDPDDDAEKPRAASVCSDSNCRYDSLGTRCSIASLSFLKDLPARRRRRHDGTAPTIRASRPRR